MRAFPRSGCCCVGYFVAASAIDTWTVVRFAGSRTCRRPPAAWHDSVFNKPLSFYLFDLPFYSMLRSYVLALVIVSILLYWIAARAWQLRYKLGDIQQAREIDPAIFRLEGGLESRFLRGAAVFLLMALAVRFFLGRYEMVYNEHGTFLVGVDYVDHQYRAAAAVAADFRLLRGLRAAADGAMDSGGQHGARAGDRVCGAAGWFPRCMCGPTRFRSNARTSIPISTPHAALTGWSITLRKSISMPTRTAASIPHSTRILLDNVRLWDYQAFHDTITQLQALRTYYVFHDERCGPVYHRQSISPGAAGGARVGYCQPSGCAQQLDQPGFHLHPRLRPGAGGSQ